MEIIQQKKRGRVFLFSVPKQWWTRYNVDHLVVALFQTSWNNTHSNTHVNLKTILSEIPIFATLHQLARESRSVVSFMCSILTLVVLISAPCTCKLVKKKQNESSKIRVKIRAESAGCKNFPHHMAQYTFHALELLSVLFLCWSRGGVVYQLCWNFILLKSCSWLRLEHTSKRRDNFHFHTYETVDTRSENKGLVGY